jgi:hypothetical protein
MELAVKRSEVGLNVMAPAPQIAIDDTGFCDVVDKIHRMTSVLPYVLMLCSSQDPTNVREDCAVTL